MYTSIEGPLNPNSNTRNLFDQIERLLKTFMGRGLEPNVDGKLNLFDTLIAHAACGVDISFQTRRLIRKRDAFKRVQR